MKKEARCSKDTAKNETLKDTERQQKDMIKRHLRHHSVFTEGAENNFP